MLRVQKNFIKISEYSPRTASRPRLAAVTCAGGCPDFSTLPVLSNVLRAEDGSRSVQAASSSANPSSAPHPNLLAACAEISDASSLRSFASLRFKLALAPIVLLFAFFRGYPALSPSEGERVNRP